ncbi:flagellar motor protein [Salinisphaera dokdonensis CL-ES53]|uniref:Flagellar motor protein n=1 Tax=Salinisphaera dokdonensis CL-ES53 TaxID=1304272 RepID=A0ABV2AZU9_9GAMM
MRYLEEDMLEDEGAGYLVSVSDIMAGLLFVFIITLMAFVIQFNEAKQEQQQQVDQLTNNDEIRADLLQLIQSELDKSGITVTINADSGVLLLGEDTVPFETGQQTPEIAGIENLKLISEKLATIIPCYAQAQPAKLECAPEKRGKLESIFIEGHTDDNPIIGRPHYSNWNLSSDRAITSFQVIRDEEPDLVTLENTRSQPLFSVSGYAAQRPRIDRPDLSPSDGKQRRIEMRFIMTPPDGAVEVEPKRDLQDGELP